MEYVRDGTERQVAIKKISDVLHDLIDAKRLLREIQIGRHLAGQENIISTVDVMVTRRSPDDEDDLYIVTDLFPTDLHRVVHSKNVPLGGDHVKFFLWQLLCATKYMHSAGVVHRDIKPSNILVNSECDLRVCDFGLARGLEAESKASGDGSGDGVDGGNEEEEFMTEYVVTRWYRAPEILLGSRSYLASVDIWSIGCVFAEMLARRALFPGDNSLDQVTKIMKVLGTFLLLIFAVAVASDLRCLCAAACFSRFFFVGVAWSTQFSSSSSSTLAGTFGEDDILDFASDAACRWVLKQPQFPQTPFSELFPQAPADALDLLQSLLELRPDRRCSADAALRHPYLADYHDPEEEPLCEDGFHFEFEKSDLDKETIRGLIRRAASFVGTVPRGAEVHDVTGGGSGSRK